MTFTKNKTSALRELNNSTTYTPSVKLGKGVYIDRKSEGVYTLLIFNGVSGEGFGKQTHWHIPVSGSFAQCWAEFIKNWND